MNAQPTRSPVLPLSDPPGAPVPAVLPIGFKTPCRRPAGGPLIEGTIVTFRHGADGLIKAVMALADGRRAFASGHLAAPFFQIQIELGARPGVFR